MSKKKNNQGNQKINNIVLRILEQGGQKPLNINQIASRLPRDEKNIHSHLEKTLNALTKAHKIERVQNFRYRLLSKEEFYEGKLEMTANGYGFVSCEDLDEDVFISSKNLNHALNGDVVRIRLLPKNFKKKIEGAIVEIISREQIDYVGIFHLPDGQAGRSKNFGFVVPADKRMATDIYIPSSSMADANDGDKVVARIVKWEEEHENPLGEIIRVLGKPGENETEMHAILAEFGFTPEFPESVENEANKISRHISPHEISRRKDFRSITTFTIDPATAKDFDDALSIEFLSNGNFSIGVHIADVSHYVTTNTVMDKEAVHRGNSVYLVDRTVPMLPEALSNQLCSLNPKEDKLTFSAVFELNKNVEVIHRWFGKTIIHSDKRFTYEEAQEIMDKKQGLFFHELDTLNRLAKKMRDKRFRNGAIDFETEEVAFHLDEKGRPTGVYIKHRRDSHKLIEEFMLLANREVAEFISHLGDKKNVPFVYRVHDHPDMEKIYLLKEFVKHFGYHLEIKNESVLSHSLNRLIESVVNTPLEHVVETAAIRSMAKAIYTIKNIGHYGLGMKSYTHFTSPIRRYPDLLVHRLLEKYLNQKSSVNYDSKSLEQQCKHCSEMERQAERAERESVKYKQVEFMQSKIGKVYDGIISGVTQWGIYVELNEFACDGMVSIRDLKDDFYIFDEKSYSMIGRRKKKNYRLGDKVRVMLKKTDLENRTMDFIFVEDE